MPSTEDLNALVSEFNHGENVIVFTSPDNPRHSRMCSFLAKAGVPFISVPDGETRIIVVLANPAEWEPIWRFSEVLDPDAMAREIVAEAMLKGVTEGHKALGHGAFAAPMASAGGAPPGAPGFPGPKGSETGNFVVLLAGLSDSMNLISVIKVVRDMTSLGLKAAKDLVDEARSGQARGWGGSGWSGVKVATFESRDKANMAAANLYAKGGIVHVIEA